MHKIYNLYKAELNSWLINPRVYIGLFLYLFASGKMFTDFIKISGKSNMEEVIPNLFMMILFFVPFLSVISITIENRNNTNSLILMSPTYISDIILSKYLSVCTICIGMFMANLLQLFSISVIYKLNMILIFSSFFGYIILTAAIVAIGMFIATFSDNPYLNIIITYVIYMVLYILRFTEELIPDVAKSLYNIISIFNNTIGGFITGNINIGSIFHLITVALLFLYLTFISLEERWYL